MKIIKVNLSEDFKDIKVLSLSDMHIGDANCNIEAIKKVLGEIKESSNTFTILNGDLINNATKNSVSDIYSEKLSPMEQIVKLCDLLEPIKDKILVIHPGNHENRTYKEDGVDITRIVAKQLGIEDRYSDTWWYLYLSVGKSIDHHRPILYTITGVHGYGGGRKSGGKINNLVEMSDKVVADIYIMGHTHTPIMTRNSIYVPDYQHRSLVKKDKYYLMTNSFLEYGGYGEILGFTPSTTEHQEMILDGRKKLIKIIM